METNKKTKISFLGFGAFNCAFAYYLTKKFAQEDNYSFFFWDIDDTIFKNFTNNQKHPYHFTELKFNHKIQGCLTPTELLKDADIVILGINAQNFNSALKDIYLSLTKPTTFVIISKGIDSQTHELLSTIVRKNIQKSPFQHNIAVFSGGTTASDIVNEAPLIAEVACENEVCVKLIADLFHSNTLRIYTNQEVSSVELAGALKNFISLGAGICEGLGFPIGTKTSFITRAAFDVYKIAKQLGSSDTIFLPGSASFWGDIMLSSFGETRNREFGRRICTRQKNPQEILEEMKKGHKTVEGYHTIKAAYEIAQKYKIETTAIDAVYEIVYKNADPQIVFKKIMSRPRKQLGI